MSTKFLKQQTTDDLGINWKEFYKGVFILVVPMALQNLINVGITSTDVVMLGKVSETVLSGASLAGQIQFMMMLLFMGITSGATVLTAQYWGKKDTRTIEKVLSIGLRAGLLVAILFAALAFAIPNALMRIFTNESLVVAEGAKYLKIVAFSYLFMAITQVYLNIMRSIERVVIATLVYLASLVTNFIINYLLIFGMFGFPKMGIEGAAVGTLIARIVETIIVIFYAVFKNKVVRIRIKDLFQVDRLLLKDYLVYSIPVIINELMWGAGTAANAAIIGHLGSSAVAANSVAQVTRQLATVVVFGVSNATAIYLGRTIGEGKLATAKAYGKKFVKLSIILGILGAGVILLVGPIANANLELTSQAKQYLTFMLYVMAYFVIAQSVNATLVVGVFRSGGDTKFGLILEVATMWGCSIVLGAFAAFVLKLGVPIVYMILMSDELIKLPLTLKRFTSYKWIRNVTRERV